jgi:hypothetical protein
MPDDLDGGGGKQEQADVGPSQHADQFGQRQLGPAERARDAEPEQAGSIEGPDQGFGQPACAFDLVVERAQRTGDPMRLSVPLRVSPP